MTAHRYSLAVVLRQVRGARSSLARAQVRYARNIDVKWRALLIGRALRDAEKQLCLAIRDALARRRGECAKGRAA